MPRSIQAFTQNAAVTNSPQNVSTGDPTQALEDAQTVFAPPSLLDICTGATNGTQNPFVAGLNDMGTGSNTSGVAGRTGNILSGLQMFTDSLCGYGLGGGSVGNILQAYRNLKAQGHTVESLRQLRDTVGAGTTPQSVIGAVSSTNDAAFSHPFTAGMIGAGQASNGASGNQIIDGINGANTLSQSVCGIATGATSAARSNPLTMLSTAQSLTTQANKVLSGSSNPTASGIDLLTNGSSAVNQNTSKHVGSTSLTTAQSVSLKNQSLLVTQDFANAYSVTDDPKGNWSWDGTDGDPATNVLGCLKCAVNGLQDEYLSNEIPVAAAENIEVSATVKWQSLTYTGASPLILGVQKYRLMKNPDGSSSYTDIGGYDVVTVTSPGTNSSSSTGNFVGIAGIYTVEPGVDQIRLRCKVATNATAGTVKFDNCDFLKTDLIADEAVPGIGITTDNIVTQLYGAAGAGFTHNDAAVALANTASSLASVSSKVAALDAEGSTGAIAGDDFNWTGEITTSANWGGHYSSTGHGSYQADGVDAKWVTAGSFKGVSAFFDWEGTDSVSTTDYQLIQAVLDSNISHDTRFPTAAGALYLFGRITSDWLNYILFKLSGNGAWVVVCNVAGAATTLQSGTTTAPGIGASISLYCGDKASSKPRHYKAVVGTTVVADFDEVGTTSQFGSTYRGWGWGGQADAVTAGYIGATYFPGEWLAPPKINQWLATDQ